MGSQSCAEDTIQVFRLPRAELLEEINSTMLIRGVLYGALISFSGFWALTPASFSSPPLAASPPPSHYFLPSPCRCQQYLNPQRSVFDLKKKKGVGGEGEAFLVNVQVCAFVKATVLHNERAFMENELKAEHGLMIFIASVALVVPNVFFDSGAPSNK